MSRPTRATARRTADAPASTRIMSLDQLELALVDAGTRPVGDIARMRATTRALLALSGPTSTFATIRCERCDDGRLRITGGSDAITVARALRARADWRGDHAWAALLGRRLLFRVELGRATQHSARDRTRRGIVRGAFQVLRGAAA